MTVQIISLLKMLREETGQRHIISVGCEMNAKYYFLYKANERRKKIASGLPSLLPLCNGNLFTLFFISTHFSFLIINTIGKNKQNIHNDNSITKKMARKAMILQNLMGWFCGLQSLRSNKRTAKRNETNALISSFEILHQFIC